MALTDTAIKNAKPKAKPYKLYDRDRLSSLMERLRREFGRASESGDRPTTRPGVNSDRHSSLNRSTRAASFNSRAEQESFPEMNALRVPPASPK